MTISSAQGNQVAAALREADVVVLGGGPAGVAAALTSARQGASTILVERYGFLGGAGTASMVTNFCGLYANVHGRHERVVFGITQEITERLAGLDGLREPHLIRDRIWAQAYDTSVYKCVLDQLLLDAGVKLMFHSLAVGVRMADGQIAELLLETKSGRLAVRSKVFIDCSGDGDLASWSGVKCVKGNQSGHLAFPTMMFRVGNVDDQRALQAKPDMPRLMLEAENRGDFSLPRKSASIGQQKHAGEWRCNLTHLAWNGRAIDGTSAEELSFGETEGRRQVMEYFRFLRTCVPGFENSYILEIAAQLGIRETRRICGRFVLSGDDILEAKNFDDTIGVNGWPVEMHLHDGVEWKFIEGRGYCHLPYRMILPTGTSNLLVAGRCASMSSDAQAAARVSGACFVMGQAAGTAAAMSVDGGVMPDRISVARLQKQLSTDGVYLGL